MSPFKRGPDLLSVNRRLSELNEAEKADYAFTTTQPMDISDAPTRSDTLTPASRWQSGDATPRDEDMTPSGAVTPYPDDYDLSRTPRNRDLTLIRIKTETRKKWTTNSKRGIKTTTRYFYQEIDSSWTASLIICCYFTAGLVDAVTYEAWSTFVSMQTGNTIFCALRISTAPTAAHPLQYVKNLVSIGSYLVGGLFFNILHRAPSSISDMRAPLHRWTLLTAFVAQTLAVVGAAILASTGHISTNPAVKGQFSSGSWRNSIGLENYLDLLGIALLAFEAAGQVCLSRVLLVNELPTIVISTLYHDLISEGLTMRKAWKDSKTTWDFVVTQKKQIRRALSILSLFLGALVGGYIYRSKGGLSASLWTAAGTKVIICLAWCLWKKKVVTETVVTTEPPKPATGR